MCIATLVDRIFYIINAFRIREEAKNTGPRHARREYQQIEALKALSELQRQIKQRATTY
jgi:hypothetical protein